MLNGFCVFSYVAAYLTPGVKLNIMIIRVFHFVPGVPLVKMERFAGFTYNFPVLDGTVFEI
jgi:hypothetical protein